MNEKVFQTLDYHLFEQFIKKYEMLKEFHKLQDYTSILQKFVNIKDIRLPVDYLFVDEAQDLTNLQWGMVRKIEENCGASFVAGDDKQSIYVWAGANPEALVNLEGEREILEQSYRLKSNIVLLSETIAGKIKVKSPYTIKALADGGKVEYVRSVEGIDMSKGSWLLIARLNKDLEVFRQLCIRSGFKYSCADDDKDEIFNAVRIWEGLRNGQWIQADQIKKVLPFLPSGTVVARGKKTEFEQVDDRTSLNMSTMKAQYGILNDGSWYDTFRLDAWYREAIRKMCEKEGVLTGPRIKILTIHGCKGLEADNVVLIPKLSRSCRDSLMTNPDLENRVFYVAVTRTKENLFILKSNEDDYQI